VALKATGTVEIFPSRQRRLNVQASLTRHVLFGASRGLKGHG